jgi:hypothetical protein
MSKTYELKCMGMDVTAELGDDNAVTFFGYDEGVVASARALGLSQLDAFDICEALKQAIEEGEEEISMRAAIFAAHSEDFSTQEALRLLLDLGADPNADDGRAMIWASALYPNDGLKLLLDYGGDPKNRALLYAAEKGYAPAVALMLSYMEPPDENDMITALLSWVKAKGSGRQEAMEILDERLEDWIEEHG